MAMKWQGTRVEGEEGRRESWQVTKMEGKKGRESAGRRGIG